MAKTCLKKKVDCSVEVGCCEFLCKSELKDDARYDEYLLCFAAGAEWACNQIGATVSDVEYDLDVAERLRKLGEGRHNR